MLSSYLFDRLDFAAVADDLSGSDVDDLCAHETSLAR
jgi:hypothetical protein